MKLFLLIIFLINYSYAILGIGGYYELNNAKIKSGESNLTLSNGDELIVKNGSSSTFSGGGVVIWIDAIPIIDIEVSAHIKYMTYKSEIGLSSSNTFSDLGLDFFDGLPLFPSKTVFGEFNGDVSILYPLITIPPILKILKFYVGGGLSYGIFTRVFDKDFISDAIGWSYLSDKFRYHWNLSWRRSSRKRLFHKLWITCSCRN